MHEVHRRTAREAVIPAQQVRLVAMRGKSAERVYLREAAHALAVDAHFGRTVDELSPERSRRLEADDDHVALRSLEIVFEVMQHAAAVRHAGAGDDERAAAHVVDGARIVRRSPTTRDSAAAACRGNSRAGAWFPRRSDPGCSSTRGSRRWPSGCRERSSSAPGATRRSASPVDRAAPGCGRWRTPARSRCRRRAAPARGCRRARARCLRGRGAGDCRRCSP